MLSGGLSLEVFKQWAPFEQNMVVVPGYCIPGTVGYKLQPGKLVTIDIDKRTRLEVRCQVHHLSFSAHTDAKGIMDLLRLVGPKHVILVHGEKPKMAMLKTRVSSELGIPCFDPANGEVIEIPSRLVIKVLASEQFLAGSQPGNLEDEVASASDQDLCFKGLPAHAKNGSRTGIIMMDQQKTIQVLHPQEALDALDVSQHTLLYRCYCPVYMAAKEAEEGEIQEELKNPSKKVRRDTQSGSALEEHQASGGSRLEEHKPINKGADEASTELTEASEARDAHLLHEEKTESLSVESSDVLQAVHEWLMQKLGSNVFRKQNNSIVGGHSLCIRVSCEHLENTKMQAEKSASAVLACTWSSQDEGLANRVVALINLKHIPS